MTVALGFFDGVHRGHRAVLAGADAVLTFRTHPRTVLHPEENVPLLMSEMERLTALRASVPQVVALDFTPALADETPEDFLGRLRALFPRGFALRLGPDARFGRGGTGDAAFLRTHGVPVTSVPPFVYGSAPVSSTRIRQALGAGDVPLAEAMLGHPYAVCGTIRSGKGLGREIGFPTVNVHPGRTLPLRTGVWLVRTPFGRGLANWGTAPTLGAAAWTSSVLEVHLAVSPPAAYVREGLSFAVTFERFVRPERTFPDLGSLCAALAEDCRLLDCGVDAFDMVAHPSAGNGENP